MNYSKDIYIEYYDRGQDVEYLRDKLVPDDTCFTELLKQDIEETKLSRDAEMLELQMLPLYIFETQIDFSELVSILNDLLIEDWHEQHENIVTLLEDILSPSSVPFLKSAIEKKYNYLNWDTNKSFERKCIWTLGKIGTDQAYLVLKECSKMISPLSEYANEQLYLWKTDR